MDAVIYGMMTEQEAAALAVIIFVLVISIYSTRLR